ncbi:MAG: hypothetical protein KDJ87_02415 [Rhizobiaceae bacterium]|nr:hypothetical protein [Rhizobiaceae bacterium]
MAEGAGMDRPAARLLRFLGNGGCRISESAGRVRLARPDGGEISVTAAAMAACLRQGLAVRRGERLFATPEARSWLRRFLAGREEAFLDQHRVVEVAELRQDGETRAVRINAVASPLAALARLRDRGGAAWLSPDAVAAGERLARDFHYGALQPRVTQSYEARTGERPRPGPGAALDLRDSVLAARLRVAAAVEAMGPELSGVALDVCCFEKGLETVERERLWPPRSAKLMLKTALMQLHRHYDPPAPPPSRRRHAWGAEGYRPEIGGA